MRSSLQMLPRFGLALYARLLVSARTRYGVSTRVVAVPPPPSSLGG